MGMETQTPEMINERFDQAIKDAPGRGIIPPMIDVIDGPVRAYCLYLIKMYKDERNPDDVIDATVHAVVTMMIELAGAVTEPANRHQFVVSQLMRGIASLKSYLDTREAVETKKEPSVAEVHQTIPDGSAG